MLDPIKSQVQKQFGRAAQAYATSDVHSRGESLQLLVDWIRPQPDWLALDVATAAGHTALAFAPHVARVVATDITGEMVIQATQLAADHGLTNVETQLADAEALPFADAAFDLLTCRLALHHFPNPRTAVGEFARVLKPGGVLGFTDNVTVDSPQAADFYNQYETVRDPSHQRAYSLPELERLFAECGFVVRQSRTLTKEMEFEEWAERQQVSDADKERLRAMLRTLPAELEPLFQPHKTDGTLYFSLWEAVLVGVRA